MPDLLGFSYHILKINTSTHQAETLLLRAIMKRCKRWILMFQLPQRRVRLSTGGFSYLKRKIKYVKAYMLHICTTCYVCNIIFILYVLKRVV